MVPEDAGPSIAQIWLVQEVLEDAGIDVAMWVVIM